MIHPYLIDLNNPENWLYPIELFSPNGIKGEDQRTIHMGVGKNRLMCVTDSVMLPGDPNNLHCHEHYKGYEDFFVDSGGMDLYVNGKKTFVGPGNIIHLQPFEAHGMTFREPTKYRGFFHNLSNSDDAAEIAILRKHNPGIEKRPDFRDIALTAFDSELREKPIWQEVPAEQVPSVRNIARPLDSFELPGATLKMITARWENGGINEMWAAELKKGFFANSIEFPTFTQMFYVTAGEINFKVYGEEFTAYPECIVKIPKFARHTISALTDSVIYDVNGLTRWYAFFQDRASILKYDPDRASKPETIEALRSKFNCQYNTIGLK